MVTNHTRASDSFPELNGKIPHALRNMRYAVYFFHYGVLFFHTFAASKLSYFTKQNVPRRGNAESMTSRSCAHNREPQAFSRKGAVSRDACPG